MGNIQSINAERIKWCCDDRGISLEELAKQAGIAWDAFHGMMEGKRGITFNQLRKAASCLNRGALFFLEPRPVIAEQAHTPQFRTIANQKPELSAKLKALIERAERQREVYLSVSEDLGERKETQFVPPKFQPENVVNAAQIARQWLGLSEQNDFNSYRTAVEDKGILVFQCSGYIGKWQIAKEEPICGFTLYDAVCPVIVIKKASKSRQVFTLMHELGHVLLHRSSFIDENDDLYSYQGKEQEANAFAGHLLVPRDFLEHIKDHECPSEFPLIILPFRPTLGTARGDERARELACSVFCGGSALLRRSARTSPYVYELFSVFASVPRQPPEVFARIVKL